MATAAESLLALRGKRVTGSEIRSQNGVLSFRLVFFSFGHLFSLFI